MAKKRANGEGNIRKRTDGTHGVGQAVDPHFGPHCFQHFCNKKAPKTEVFDAFWSCWADSNRRPHPYQLYTACFCLLGAVASCCPAALLYQGIRGFLRCFLSLLVVP